MSYKNTKNPVTAFLKSAGIKKEDNLQTLLTKEYGKEAADKLKSALDAIELKQDKNSADRTEYYDFVNSQRKFTQLITCYEDADYLAEICRWLNMNRDRLGKTILDVGCGSGIITCFLAQLLPEATILAVDKSINAVTMAKELRDSLELTNVVFMRADIAEVSGRTFDTVLALRTLTENYLFKDEPFVSFGNSLEKYCHGIRPYMETISKLVAEDGNLIIAEPDYRQITTLGIQNEMNHVLLGVENKNISQITCRMGDEKDFTKYQIYVGTQGTVISNQQVFERWEKETVVRENDGTYVGIGACYMCWELAGEVLNEVRVHHRDTKQQCGLFATYTVKGHDDLFLLYQEDGLNASLGIFPISRQAEAVTFLMEQYNEYRSQGYLVV